MSMKGLFWNRKEARLRAGWRVILFIVASGVASTALAGPGRRFLGRLLPVVYANVVEAVVLVLLIGVFLWMAARWLDHRPIVDYGFHLSRAWWLDLGFGLALGLFLMAGVYALALAIGWVKVTGSFVSPPGQPFIAAILADVVVVEGDSAARLWTGWPFTVEGGLLGTGAFVLGLLLIAAWVRLRRGSVRLDPSLVQPPIQTPATPRL
jgi:hypothetical protein